jgi:hypothetical protein
MYHPKSTLPDPYKTYEIRGGYVGCMLDQIDQASQQSGTKMLENMYFICIDLGTIIVVEMVDGLVSSERRWSSREEYSYSQRLTRSRQIGSYV